MQLLQAKKQLEKKSLYSYHFYQQAEFLPPLLSQGQLPPPPPPALRLFLVGIFPACMQPPGVAPPCKPGKAHFAPFHRKITACGFCRGDGSHLLTLLLSSFKGKRCWVGVRMLGGARGKEEHPPCHVGPNPALIHLQMHGADLESHPTLPPSFSTHAFAQQILHSAQGRLFLNPSLLFL